MGFGKSVMFGTMLWLARSPRSSISVLMRYGDLADQIQGSRSWQCSWFVGSPLSRLCQWSGSCRCCLHVCPVRFVAAALVVFTAFLSSFCSVARPCSVRSAECGLARPGLDPCMVGACRSSLSGWSLNHCAFSSPACCRCCSFGGHDGSLQEVSLIYFFAFCEVFLHRDAVEGVSLFFLGLCLVSLFETVRLW